MGDTNLWRKNARGMQRERSPPIKTLGRMGRPEELANTTVFLYSERASYITGVSLNMDGGPLKGLW